MYTHMHIKNDQTQATTAVPWQFCNNIRGMCLEKRKRERKMPKNKNSRHLNSSVLTLAASTRVQSLQSSGTRRLTLNDFARMRGAAPPPPQPPTLPPTSPPPPDLPPKPRLCSCRPSRRDGSGSTGLHTLYINIVCVGEAERM